jgi:hypothetical protein
VALAATAPAEGGGGGPDAVAAVALAVAAPAEGGGGCPDAVAAVALAVAAPAESALEFAREAHTAGPFEHTRAYFYDLDDPNFGFDDQTCVPWLRLGLIFLCGTASRTP